MSSRNKVVSSASLVRELNKALVLNMIREGRLISRADIAKRTRLSRSTVSAIVDQLLEAGLTHEQGVGESRGGEGLFCWNSTPGPGLWLGLTLGLPICWF